MGGNPFSLDMLRRNFAVLAASAPEVACWLEAEADFATARERAALLPSTPQTPNPLTRPGLQAGGITVVVGGGLLDQVLEFLAQTPPGHQVFVLEPQAQTLALGLGRHLVEEFLREGDLVLLAPGEAALEEALHRHPQLALTEHLDLISLPKPHPPQPQDQAAHARLCRVLGQAVKARDLALNWEGPAGANLIRNLSHLAFMGHALETVGALEGRLAVLVEDGPSLPGALKLMAGRLGGAALFCSDQALPRLLEAGILPTAVGITNPGKGPLWGYSHPLLAQVPMVAEEVAHASTVKAHPGTRFLCLGPRVGVPGPLGLLAPGFTPQHHCLARLAEMAALCGCRGLVLVGTDLCHPQGELTLPGMAGEPVRTTMDQAAAASSLGRALARSALRALNTAVTGLGLPGTRAVPLMDVLPQLGPQGQPLRLPALEKDRWLTAEDLAEVARGLMMAAAGATRLWQRAAAPLVDFPCGRDKQAAALLNSADHLFVALAEQAAAEPLLSAFMGGCLVRAFRRRHRLLCRCRDRGVTVDETCRELQRCLVDMESRAGELSVAMRQMAEEFSELAQASNQGDAAFLEHYARQAGHPALAPPLA